MIILVPITRGHLSAAVIYSSTACLWTTSFFFHRPMRTALTWRSSMNWKCGKYSDGQMSHVCFYEDWLKKLKTRRPDTAGFKHVKPRASCEGPPPGNTKMWQDVVAVIYKVYKCFKKKNLNKYVHQTIRIYKDGSSHVSSKKNLNTIVNK